MWCRALSNPLWAQVAAVRSGRVYLAPHLPFGWFDRPPSVNRLIGLPWLRHILYPGESPADLRQQTRNFYQMFYHVELDERQLDRLLGNHP